MPRLPAEPTPTPLDLNEQEAQRVAAEGARDRAMALLAWSQARDDSARQVDARDLGSPWDYSPSQGEFWGRVHALAGTSEPADVTEARDRQGFRLPRIPDAGSPSSFRAPPAPVRPVAPSIAAPWSTRVAPAPAEPQPAPAPAPPRTAARPWSAGTIEESALPPAMPATPPQPRPARTPLADDDKYAFTLVPPEPQPATRPGGVAPPAAAPAADNPVDRQIQVQGDRRRNLSESELLAIREAMSHGDPNEAPTFNPLQAYRRSSRDLPPEQRARESVTDWLMGYFPRNKLTRREIVEDVDRQLLRAQLQRADDLERELAARERLPAFDRQLDAQNMTRRILSPEMLMELRAGLAQQPPGDVPRRNVLQHYPVFGRFDLPPEDTAEGPRPPGSGPRGVDLFGHQPRNRLTYRDIIAEIDRQLEDWRQRSGMSEAQLQERIRVWADRDRALTERARQRQREGR